MNRVALIGRLTLKPELRYTQSNIATTRFTVAVNRNYTGNDGERKADFINVVAWRKQAETITKYFDKGSQIAIEGRIQTDNYTDKDGNKRNMTNVVLENFEFVESKKRDDNEVQESKVEEKEETDPFAEFGEQIEADLDNNYLE